MERIVHEKVLTYLNFHHFISPMQHGFLSKRSTLTNLLETSLDWTSRTDDRNNIDVVYIVVIYLRHLIQWFMLSCWLNFVPIAFQIICYIGLQVFYQIEYSVQTLRVNNILIQSTFPL